MNYFLEKKKKKGKSTDSQWNTPFYLNSWCCFLFSVSFSFFLSTPRVRERRIFSLFFCFLFGAFVRSFCIPRSGRWTCHKVQQWWSAISIVLSIAWPVFLFSLLLYSTFLLAFVISSTDITIERNVIWPNDFPISSPACWLVRSWSFSLVFLS